MMRLLRESIWLELLSWLEIKSVVWFKWSKMRRLRSGEKVAMIKPSKLKIVQGNFNNLLLALWSVFGLNDCLFQGRSRVGFSSTFNF